MKITAITRYKHGTLYPILQRIGWTQAELSRQSGVNQHQICDIINLVKRPTVKQADAIQKAVGIAGEYIDVLIEWPETFAGLKRGFKQETTAEVPLERLLDHPEVLQIADPQYEDSPVKDLTDHLEALMSELPERMRIVLHERFWNNASLAETGKKIKRSGALAHKIEMKALQWLRHPRRVRQIQKLALGLE